MDDQIVKRIVETNSTTNSEQEIKMGQVICELIGSQPYFQNHSEQYGLYFMESDPLKRCIPWALYRARNREARTLVLAGHMDTVSIKNYGPLQDCALHPDRLKQALSNEILPDEVRKDLESGEWMFGRGTADMKGGLSVFLQEFFQVCAEDRLTCNLLFLAVPDEETYSAGMRRAVALLLNLKEQYTLNYQLLLMSESHIREDRQALYYDGTIGKIQVACVVKGAPAHVRYYYTGLNPVLVAAQIVCDIDGNASLSEQVGTEKTPPPSFLYCRDTKTRYDVTLSESVDLALSFLTYRRTGMQILELLKENILHSVHTVAGRNARQYQSWAETLPVAPPAYTKGISVLFYEELVDLAQKKHGETFSAYYQTALHSVSEELAQGTINFNSATLKMVHAILDYLDSEDPMIILAITPPLYPGFTNQDILPEGSPILTIPARLCQFSKDACNQPARYEHYFAGISDMSYCATTYASAEQDFIHRNMPIWGKNYSIDFAGIAQLQIPVLNVGPWGKNIHTKFERVNLHSLLNECPTLIRWLVEDFSNGNTSQ